MFVHCTKWAELVHLRDKSMEAVSRAFEEQIVMRHGPPVEVLTDNGKVFDNRVLLTLCMEYGTTWKHGSPYNLTTTGLVGSCNRTLMDKLKKKQSLGSLMEQNVKGRRIFLSTHRAIRSSQWKLQR
ncbi:Gag-Pol polyprotein [Nosema granulosis]|uniref:Gag-Pol polyprotein n=1 Tax=Nosema granulosis TaxID=83296 RepID=A0A9P6GVS7_9MICR|nr:Gag-Pol polyprotein [Nosema granulosis]